MPFQYTLMVAGFAPLTINSKQPLNGASVQHDLLELEANVTKEGYIYIYLSNENDMVNEVFFDDFKVEHIESPVIQVADYYPFGLQHSTSWTRSNSVKNNRLFNGGSELNEITDNYETYYRNYDPALGRFMAIDPMASSFTSWSPYNYAYNDPVYWNDPKGDYGRSGSVNDEMQLRNTHMFHYHKDGSAGFGNAGNGGGSGGGSAGGSGGGGSGGNGTLTYDFYTILNDDVFSEEQYVVLPGATVDAIERGNPYRGWGDANYWINRVGEPGFYESMIPIWGAGRDAIDNYQSGDYSQAVAYAALAVTDVFLVRSAVKVIGKFAAKAFARAAAKTGVQAVEQVAVHGNSLKSLKPTWGYKLYSTDGTFLKNGITSAVKAESRYTKTFMQGKYMDKFPFPNRAAAHQWEFQQNQILRGPLNLNMH